MYSNSIPRAPERGRGRGQSSRFDGSSLYRNNPAGGRGSSSNMSSGRTPQPRPVGSSSKQFNHTNTTKYQYKQVNNSSSVKDISSDIEKLELADNSAEEVTPISNQQLSLSVSSPEKDFTSLSSLSNSRNKEFNAWTPHKGKIQDNDVGTGALDNKRIWMARSSFKDIPYGEGSQCDKGPQKKTLDSEQVANFDSQSTTAAFDICNVRSGSVVTLKAPLHVQNRIKRDEAKRSVEGKDIIELKPGMLILKKHISFNDQIKIVKECRELGLGCGGFYEPGYRDGGKLHLKMMCLGKNWDPEKSKYGVERPTDGAKPPLIPSEFHQLVTGAIEACHSFLRENPKVFNVERVLPSMMPNICIVNFYTKSGRLGLHQDKDESKESIDRGLPVVSFSIGDSAEFLYSDQRDTEKADKVTLESGDVLIFGGESRRIFHGVASILADTAPKTLLEETRMRSGRLNLTFREY